MSAKKTIPFKQWRHQEAERLHITVNALNHLVYGKHAYRWLRLHRKNARVIEVEVG